MSPRTSRNPSDRGSAGPLVVAVMMALVAVSVALVAGASVVLTQSRARTAADVAALAAARVDRDSRALGWTRSGSLARGCAEADVIARANGAVVVACARGESASVVVTVTVEAPGVGGGATATARAGPAR